MSHTKGKWEAHNKMTETESGLKIIPVYNFAPNTRPTGRCICAVSGHDPEAQANARLIAAAPALLAACKDLINANVYARRVSLRGEAPQGSVWGEARSCLDAAKLNAQTIIRKIEARVLTD
ncbi:hypothetical protein LCGC14_3008660 [marine sediment metagenome]|uniref:Uncharacterized protein n=1 Tax=marine sediment metagenome TaxID=412755 RepID=A0A0F8ZQ37_9ZZZZ